MPIAALALRSWLRYFAPLTAIAVAAFAALAAADRLAGAIAGAAALDLFAVPARAIDAAAVHAELRAGWVVAGGAWIVQLALAGAALPAVRALRAGSPLAQHRAALAGLGGLARAIAPCLVATLAVALGLAALVVPGIVLLGLFAFAGAAAAAADGPPAPDAALRASVAVARAHLREVAIVVGLVLALDLGIALVAQLAIVHPVPPKALPQAFALARAFARVVAVAIAGTSALAACALAAMYDVRSRAA